MFTLIHFMFMLFKIALLATAYATLTFFFLYIIVKKIDVRLIKKWMVNKFRTWCLIEFIYSVALFIFSFTYWGNHGLGDSSRVPVGFGQAIHNGDGDWTYFYPDQQKPFEQKRISNFLISKGKLLAEKGNGEFLIYDLQSSELIELENSKDYHKYALEKGLPTSNYFKDFFSHYKSYWNGWRLYLLP